MSEKSNRGVRTFRWAATVALAAALALADVSAGDAQGKPEKGRATYNSYCITCHGPNLVNFGTRAPDLRKFPLDQFERFVSSVKSGKGSMPAWGELLNDEDVANLWAYIKTGGKS